MPDTVQASTVDRRSRTLDDRRARELLAAERARIEEALREAAIEPNDELSTTEMADDATDTYQNEFDQGRMDDLRDRLAAVARAEERLREGTYGRSIESGKPIPDERLEVNPTAERTVEEEEALRRRGG
jgi:DnaK suppressor protein